MNTFSEDKMTEYNIEDEKSSLASSQCLESGNGTLQKNAFRNRFTWLCCEVSSLMIFRIWVLLCISLAFYWRISKDLPLPVLFTVFVIVFIPFMVLIHVLYMKHTISKELDQLSREIIADAPGVVDKDWECIASRFNSYLYQRKLWNTKYYMYDGADCYKAFRAHLLAPFALAEDNPEKLHALEESIPCGKEALEVYLKEIDRYWKALTSEKSSSALNLEDTKLPRDVCYCKLSWGLKSVYTGFVLISAVFCYFYQIFFALNFFPLPYAAGYLIIFCTLEIYGKYKMFQNRVLPMKLENKIQFLSVIINARDSLSGELWDVVAKQMNSYLFEHKVWGSDQFFFDGAECEQFFRRHFADAPLKKSSPTGDLNLELWPYINEALAVCTCDLQV